MGCEGNRGDEPHNIASVVTEFYDPYTGFDVPEHAGHITRAGDDLTVVDKSAATEITRVSAEFAGTPSVGDILVVVEAVDGANVVETTAGDEIARR
jgi:hypothetical protein